MAGERKGITYEAIVQVALEELVRKGKLKGKVFWNEKPDAMTIEPDFTIGQDKDNPTHVFLVTHSGSAKESEKKFWRNMGELAEAKVRLPKPARVYSVAFDSVIKEDLKALQSAAFDGQLIVGDEDYGRYLQWWVEANSPGLPKDRYEKAAAIREAMKDKARTDNPKPLIDQLIRDLEKLVGKTRTELDALWAMERKRPSGKAPTARDTFLRRGAAKLLLLDNYDDVDSSGRLKKPVSGEVIGALKTMGLASESIGGPRLTDPEVLWVVRNLPGEVLAELYRFRRAPRIAEMIDTLRTLSGLEAQLSYLAKHWEDLISGAGMYRHLKLCHADPHKLLREATGAGSKRVWLFHIVMEWVKLEAGTRTAYGLAKLVEDLRTQSEDKKRRATVRAILGRDVQWRSPNTVDRSLRDWYGASPSSGFRLSEDDLARVSEALADRLASCRKPVPKDDCAAIMEALVQAVLENKLVTYREFRPFEAILRRELKRQGYDGSLEVIRACFADAASCSGALASSTTVMRVGKTLINWQSVSDQGRDHKKKELCGRAVALRYSWDATKGAFTKRPGVEKLILLVDGTWRQEDLDALARAGWDEIFYPDEMDKLVKAIV